MNRYKLNEIIAYIRSLGKLPTDAYGQRLSVEQLMDWFGLTERLTVSERQEVEIELALMIEAEVYVEKIRQLSIS